MHGKIPRSQKRSRLSGLDLLAPEQRREKALKLIAPAPAGPFQPTGNRDDR